MPKNEAVTTSLTSTTIALPKDQFGRDEMERTLTFDSETFQRLIEELESGKHETVLGCAKHVLNQGFRTLESARKSHADVKRKTALDAYIADHIRLLKNHPELVASPDYMNAFNKRCAELQKR